MSSKIRHNKQKGFTLIEVMVALTVVAVTLPALLFLLSQQIDGTAYLRDRSVAQWVAADRWPRFALPSPSSVMRDRGLLQVNLNVQGARGTGEVKSKKPRYLVHAIDGDGDRRRSG